MSAVAKTLASCCAELYELPIVEYLLGQSFHPGGRKLTRQLATAALVSPNSRVLDVACGIGTSARLVAANFGATVTGCDYSATNVQRAKQTSLAAGLNQKIQFIQADAGQLPFEPESFDVAICECSLCLFENTDAALQEIRRVLKPGGRIGISDFFLNKPVPDSLDGLLGRVLCVAAAKSANGYREALSRAGFEYIRIRTVNWTLADMIQRIRHRINLLAMANEAANTDLPVDFGDPAAVLADLEDFIARGGAGYLMATARRS